MTSASSFLLALHIASVCHGVDLMHFMSPHFLFAVCLHVLWCWPNAWPPPGLPQHSSWWIPGICPQKCASSAKFCNHKHSLYYIHLYANPSGKPGIPCSSIPFSAITAWSNQYLYLFPTHVSISPYSTPPSWSETLCASISVHMPWNPRYSSPSD